HIALVHLVVGCPLDLDLALTELDVHVECHEPSPRSPVDELICPAGLRPCRSPRARRHPPRDAAQTMPCISADVRRCRSVSCRPCRRDRMGGRTRDRTVRPWLPTATATPAARTR